MKLYEWIPMNSTSSVSNNSSTRNYPDQTDRYKKLLAQINYDKNCDYVLNSLTDRILDITVDTKNKKGISIKIIFKPYVPNYLLQVNDKELYFDTYEEVLETLVVVEIINSTTLCESTSFAEEFREYENLF